MLEWGGRFCLRMYSEARSQAWSLTQDMAECAFPPLCIAVMNFAFFLQGEVKSSSLAIAINSPRLLL